MKIQVNFDKAKDIAHDIRRRAREVEFAPHDEVIAKQIPGTAAEQAEAERQAIRAKYAAMQEQIDAAADLDTLKQVTPPIEATIRMK